VERLLAAIALRAEAARRLEGSGVGAVLRSVVEATVTLFEAEASSIALFDPATGRLVFEVAAGEKGQPVVGLSIAPDQGIAGYVFTTGQALALSDVEHDPRFGREVAAKTAFLPRSIIAVPLLDERGTIGVLEVLDKRTSAAFSLRDVELAAVFARQASVAIRASRVERDLATLLATTLRELAGEGAETDAAIEALVARAVATLGDGEGEGAGPWRLADVVARLRDADPAQVDLVTELLEVLERRAARTDRSRRGARGQRGSAAAADA
jgi:GAF domain-containing protein